MPIKVTAWACKWKCGSKVQTSRARMIFHENKCFRNPSRRACQTCKNLRDYVENDDYISWRVLECHVDATIDLTTKRCDCKKWEWEECQSK